MLSSVKVVLHVIPSSVDFTTSESMKLAKEFDPFCERQLIAVSKIDKFDKGIAEKLSGNGPGSMKLQLGCVAVLNRNQEEIDSNTSFEVMREREKQFFIKHREAFHHLSDEYKGVDQLIKKLAIIQHGRIRSTFPETIEELRKQIRTKKAELRAIPAAMTTEHECWTKFQSMINTFRESIQAKVSGDYDFRIRSNIFSTESAVASTVNDAVTDKSIFSAPGDDHIAYHIYKFQRKFQEELRNSFSNFAASDYNRLIMMAIDYATGVSLPNFQSFKIIESLFREELTRLPSICFNLTKKLHDYLNSTLLKIFHQTFDKDYPRLVQRLKEVIISKIDEAEERTIERVQDILDMENRLFTLTQEYMIVVNEKKSSNTIENKESGEQVKLPVPPQPKTAGSNVSKISQLVTYSQTTTTGPTTNDSINLLGPNEAQAAIDIQISLDTYSKVS
jgi:hypothetical protein